MVAGANAPGGDAPVTPTMPVAVVVMVVLRTRRQIEVHKVGYGRLSLPVAVRTHGELGCQYKPLPQDALALTDSAIVSSSDCRNFLEPLFCFFAGWLFLGVGEFLNGRLPRCWPKKLTVAELDWFCAGDCGAAGAETFEDEAAEGGFEDMMLPARGAHDDGVPMQRAVLNPNTKQKKRAHGEGIRIWKALAGTGCLVVSVWVPQRDGLGESERLPPGIMIMTSVHHVF